MTTPDPRLCEALQALVESTPSDRVQRLLDDIHNAASVPEPTHPSTDRLQ